MKHPVPEHFMFCQHEYVLPTWKLAITILWHSSRHTKSSGGAVAPELPIRGLVLDIQRLENLLFGQNISVGVKYSAKNHSVPRVVKYSWGQNILRHRYHPTTVYADIYMVRVRGLDAEYSATTSNIWKIYILFEQTV